MTAAELILELQALAPGTVLVISHVGDTNDELAYLEPVKGWAYEDCAGVNKTGDVVLLKI